MQVCTGLSQIDMQHGACHIDCTPSSHKTRPAVWVLNRGEAMLDRLTLLSAKHYIFA